MRKRVWWYFPKAFHHFCLFRGNFLDFFQHCFANINAKSGNLKIGNASTKAGTTVARKLAVAVTVAKMQQLPNYQPKEQKYKKTLCPSEQWRRSKSIKATQNLHHSRFLAFSFSIFVDLAAFQWNVNKFWIKKINNVRFFSILQCFHGIRDNACQRVWLFTLSSIFFSNLHFFFWKKKLFCPTF